MSIQRQQGIAMEKNHGDSCILTNESMRFFLLC